METLALQQQFWNKWNSSTREHRLDEVSLRQAREVTGWLDRLHSRDLDILEVGCGACWFCEELRHYGRVTGTDLSDEVLSRAKLRLPDVELVAGDFMDLQFGSERFDAIVTLEVLPHVADQPTFIAKLAGHLRPGGHLMMATQNAPVLRKYNRIPPPSPGQLRHWVDRRELQALLEPHFEVVDLFSVTPRANKGPMRIINSRMFRKPARALFGDRIERLQERLDLGWTLMALAKKR